MNVSGIPKLAVAIAVFISGSAVTMLDRSLIPTIWGAVGKIDSVQTQENKTTADSATLATKAEGLGTAEVRTASAPETVAVNKGASKGPRLDIVRIDKQGGSVLAGRSKPGVQVLIEADGKYVGDVKADTNGEWVLVTNHKFGSEEPSFKLRKMTEKDRVRLASAAAAEANAKAFTPGGKTAGGETERQVGILKELISSARKQAKIQKKIITAEASAKRQLAKKKAGLRKPFRPDLAMGLGKRTASTVGQRVALANVPKSVSDGVALPLPIGFVYRTAEFTKQGRRSAKLLLEYLNVRQPSRVTLTGHADERGSHDYNMDLSHRRLATVQKFLVKGGFKGKLKLIGKGETEPYQGVDRSKFSLDALHRLDRRVELKLR